MSREGVAIAAAAYSSGVLSRDASSDVIWALADISTPSELFV